DRLHAGDVHPCPLAQALRRRRRHLAAFRQHVDQPELHLEPSPEASLLGPYPPHLGPRVTLNHVDDPGGPSGARPLRGLRSSPAPGPPSPLADARGSLEIAPALAGARAVPSAAKPRSAEEDSGTSGAPSGAGARRGPGGAVDEGGARGTPPAGGPDVAAPGLRSPPRSRPPPARAPTPRHRVLRAAKASRAALGGPQGVRLLPGDPDDGGDHELCDPIAAADASGLVPEIGEQHLDLAAVVGIDRAWRVE